MPLTAGMEAGALEISQGYMPLCSASNFQTAGCLKHVSSSKQVAPVQTQRQGGCKRSRTPSAGSGGSDGPTPASDRAARRSATQKRYREQQAAKRHELEAAIAELSGRANSLSTENEQLKSRERILEKLVNCRDEQLAMWEKVGPCRNSSWQDVQMAGQGSSCSRPTDSPISQVSTEGSTMDSPVDLERYRHLTLDELRSYWKIFTSRAAELLMRPQVAAGASSLTFDADGHTSGHSSGETESGDVLALAGLVTEAWNLVKHVTHLNCTTIATLQQINLETGAPSSAPEGHWGRVVRVLDLTPQQEKDLAAMTTLYASLMEKVFEERRVIKEYLSSSTKATAEAVSVAKSRIGGATVDPASHQHDLELLSTVGCSGPMDCAERLYVNVRRERTMRCLMSTCFFGRLPTPVQLARLAVTAYPYFPDPLGILASLQNGKVPVGGASK